MTASCDLRRAEGAPGKFSVLDPPKRQNPYISLHFPARRRRAGKNLGFEPLQKAKSLHFLTFSYAELVIGQLSVTPSAGRSEL